MASPSTILRLLLGLLLSLTGIAKGNATDGFPQPLVASTSPTPEEPWDFQQSEGCVSRKTPPFLTHTADTIFRAQSPPIVPLLNNRSVSLVPVGLLSMANPMNVLGSLSRLHGRIRGAFGTNFDGREMIYGNVQLTSGLPIGIDSEFAYRTDERPILANRDFWTGDFNLVYRVSKIQWVVFRIGVGVNWIDDRRDTDWGVNSTIGFDFRIKDPWYVSTSFDWGTLGSEELFHWQVTGGVDLGRLELFIGYDFHQIRNRERKTLLAGAGVWF